MTAPPLGPVAEAAASDDPHATLVALRDRIAETIDDPTTAPRDLAALSRQLTAVLDEITRTAAPTKESPLDEFTRRRRARRGQA